ncbi:hypothetical protein [uncultured Desulfobulbus sp.]|uniref:hypothetical protein n=1 Tax=uncultured Desulfobulbus sp. TaxID=239745 RepID=UPI0029C82F25|nr:hypothetical protein [uncultured Desulfobulbus sp.]
MIIRHFIKCETCGHPHTLRIQVGHEPYQEHTFQCFECEEEIVVGMDCHPATASAHIREIQNCEHGSSEGTIINLSSGFPIPKEDRHRDCVFPSMRHTHAFSEIHDAMGVGKNAPKFSSFEEMRAWALMQKGVNELWPIVKKGWSLTAKGKLGFATEIFRQYRGGQFKESYELQFVLFDFCGRMLMPIKYHLFEYASDHCSEIARLHNCEYLKFRQFFKSTMANENIERYFETFSEYFRCFSDFSQTLMHVKYGMVISDDFEASSHAFSKTKLFYGNAFETLTSNIAVLACLNNIGDGRRFDQFVTMDLKKYLTINKANRCNPFKDTLPFQDICSCLDSTIRNASHHGGMKLVGNGRTIQYRSGGGGMLRTMSYLSYLNQCNEIMLACCALLALELVIAF